MIKKLKTAATIALPLALYLLMLPLSAFALTTDKSEYYTTDTVNITCADMYTHKTAVYDVSASTASPIAVGNCSAGVLTSFSKVVGDTYAVFETTSTGCDGTDITTCGGMRSFPPSQYIDFINPPPPPADTSLHIQLFSKEDAQTFVHFLGSIAAGFLWAIGPIIVAVIVIPLVFLVILSIAVFFEKMYAQSVMSNKERTRKHFMGDDTHDGQPIE